MLSVEVSTRRRLAPYRGLDRPFLHRRSEIRRRLSRSLLAAMQWDRLPASTWALYVAVALTAYCIYEQLAFWAYRYEGSLCVCSESLRVFCARAVRLSMLPLQMARRREDGAGAELCAARPRRPGQHGDRSLQVLGRPDEVRRPSQAFSYIFSCYSTLLNALRLTAAHFCLGGAR